MPRPTKLTRELVDKAKTYDESAYGEATPTLDGLALFLDIHKDSIFEWRKPLELSDKPTKEQLVLQNLREEFSDSVQRILRKQGLLLQSNGLKGKFNPTITSLMLSANHGMSIKSEQDIHHSGEVQFLNNVPRPKDD